MKTIEIEKKVRLQPHHLREIEQKGRFLKESKVHDRYFDTADFRYTTQNIWLRQRDGVFELKVRIRKYTGSIDPYEEFTDEQTILKYLGAQGEVHLQQALSELGLAPFCDVVTHRKSYQAGDLKIDIDNADFGDFHYQVAEVEMVVNDLAKIPEAERKIAQFIQELGIDGSVIVPAKLTHYLYAKKPEHYAALVASNVIQPIDSQKFNAGLQC